jgi:hypothetical protein
VTSQPPVNRLHRIIISNQPAALPWDNSELVVARDDDDLVAAITEFKRQPGNNLGVPGGVRTAHGRSKIVLRGWITIRGGVLRSDHERRAGRGNVTKLR